MDYLSKLPEYVDVIKSISEIIITNIVLIGQVPAPTFSEQDRGRLVMERMAEMKVDECSTDNYQNPVGIIRGTSKNKPPVFVVAHLDTFFQDDVDHNYTVKEKFIEGPGVMDNTVGVGVLISLPEIFRKLKLKFELDIVLAGVVQSIGKGNLRGIRHLLRGWPTPIRGAVCLEGCDLGRLDYYSSGMMRCEIICRIAAQKEWKHDFRPNAILILHDVINKILSLRLPQRPMSRIIFGKMSGGTKHGKIALTAKLGFEIQSDSEDMVREIYNDIRDIVSSISHKREVDLILKTISGIKPSNLQFNHPLVKATVAVMKALEIKPVSGNSESELSIFLSNNIPAVTLGITMGENYHQKDGKIEIEPLFKGIAQVAGVILAVDRGVCDA